MLFLDIAIRVFLVTGTFLFMEGVAWFTHKYIMHGFLWSWHESHHKHTEGFFEKNDYFAVVFSIPSALSIMVGMNIEILWFLLWIGYGIAAYGVFYVVFHDIIVHKRLKIKFIAKSSYLKRMIRAHQVHHRKSTKEDCEAFGFLYAPKKYDPSYQVDK